MGEGREYVNMRKLLPLGVSPIIGYQHHAFPLSISSLHPSFYDWFYSNYIQMTYLDTHHFFNFYEFEKLNPRSPFLSEMYMPKTLIGKYTNLLQFVMDSLDEDHYIVTFANEFYVPNRQGYKKYDFIHDILIYGYDLGKNILCLAGFKEHMTYGVSEISLDDFSQAFNEFSNLRNGYVAWANSMHLLQLKLEHKFSFDLIAVVELLEDYLYSRNTSNRFRLYENPRSYIYGLDTYDCIFHYLKERNYKPIDYRIFHIVYEHKKIMASRLKYFIEVKKISIDPEFVMEYAALEEQALLIRNRCVKSQFNQYDTAFLSSIIEKMKDLRDKEREIVTKLLKSLRDAALFKN